MCPTIDPRIKIPDVGIMALLQIDFEVKVAAKHNLSGENLMLWVCFDSTIASKDRAHKLGRHEFLYMTIRHKNLTGIAPISWWLIHLNLTMPRLIRCFYSWFRYHIPSIGNIHVAWSFRAFILDGWEVRFVCNDFLSLQLGDNMRICWSI